MARADVQLDNILKAAYIHMTSLPSWETAVPMNEEEKQIYLYVIKHLRGEGQPLKTSMPKTHRINVYSDASKSHVGLKVGKKTYSMKMDIASASATVLEMNAIKQSLNKLKDGEKYEWYGDNSACIGILNGSESTKVPQLLQMKGQIESVLKKKGCDVIFTTVRGGQNPADTLSRPGACTEAAKRESLFKNAYQDRRKNLLLKNSLHYMQ